MISKVTWKVCLMDRTFWSCCRRSPFQRRLEAGNVWAPAAFCYSENLPGVPTGEKRRNSKKMVLGWSRFHQLNCLEVSRGKCHTDWGSSAIHSSKHAYRLFYIALKSWCCSYTLVESFVLVLVLVIVTLSLLASLWHRHSCHRSCSCCSQVCRCRQKG